jgi:hypothetical protein
MNKIIQTVGGIFFLFIAQAVFACDYPSRIAMPDGATATKEEMLVGVKKVEQFKQEMQAYLACILEDEKAARAAIDDLAPEVEQQREEMLTMKHNAAVEDEEKMVAQFNVEIRAYKDASE